MERIVAGDRVAKVIQEMEILNAVAFVPCGTACMWVTCCRNTFATLFSLSDS